MLKHKKDDSEARNEHFKHAAIIVIALGVLIAAPNIFFGIAGVNVDTLCEIAKPDNCLADGDDFFGTTIDENFDTGLLTWRVGWSIIALLAFGAKLGMA